jgi:hypothetical protein
MQHTHLQLSVTSSLRSALTGTQEVSFQDSLNADFDVQVATKRFRFSLIPKVSRSFSLSVTLHLPFRVSSLLCSQTFSELVSREAIHFMAEDQAAFKQWVRVIKEINRSLLFSPLPPFSSHTPVSQRCARSREAGGAPLTDEVPLHPSFLSPSPSLTHLYVRGSTNVIQAVSAANQAKL